MHNTIEQTHTQADFFDTYRQKNADILAHAINCIRPKLLENGRLADAMAYSLLNGGKRIRPLLCYASAYAVQTPTSATDTFAAALECIHAYSLVHDDLPAMDDDDLRRGQPTCHIAFDEATAILAGDALQALAFELVCSPSIPAATAVKGCLVLAKASGAQGMVLGQAIDLAAVETHLSAEQLTVMHNHKTGALIEASVIMGAISAGATSDQLAKLTGFAKDIGLAFQVQDDIIDVTSDTETLGKPQGADASRNKPTYVSLLGLDAAKQQVGTLLESAMLHLTDFGASASHLRELAELIVSRKS